MRPLLTLWLLLSPLGASQLAAQAGSSIRERILQIEDRRAPSETDLLLLKGSLLRPDTAAALLSIRTLGRLERPDVAESLIPLLTDSSPRIRAATAEALGQAAQGFRKDSSLTQRGAEWPAILEAPTARVSLEHDPEVRGALALSLGRLPYLTPGEIGAARQSLLALQDSAGTDSGAMQSVARALEIMVRGTIRRLPLDTALVRRLELLTAGGDERVRRSALGALLVGQAAIPGTIVPLLDSPDEQTRRAAVIGMARLPAGAERERLISRSLLDPSAMVRVEALRTAVRLYGAGTCPALDALTMDSVLVVRLAAIDLLIGCSSDSTAAHLLAQAARPGGSQSWHTAAHALVSLSRVDPAQARALLADPPTVSVWQSRMYRARAAAVVRDTLTLLRYAADSAPNVREAAIAGLATVGGHAFDSVYRAALISPDYQLILGAAAALGGTPAPQAAVDALVASLDRVSREGRETSRDARIALLVRLHELGGRGTAPRIVPYLTDFDPVVAESAAVMLTGWTGQSARAAPRRLPIAPVSLAEVEALRGKQFHFTLGSGEGFDVELYLDDAPLTVARLARLVRRHYYDGLTLHRDVPNFVLQGGSPGANEYTGVGPFMRDELGPRSHERGTLGISTRGRDTGDGQLFINLGDNPRLDFEYTVWGRVVSGWEAVQAAREGAVIRRVEIRPR
jgi:cyclophilin family peptidyl-prolyl cis-trans isomerase/HEAT repeat protein